VSAPRVRVFLGKGYKLVIIFLFYRRELNISRRDVAAEPNIDEISPDSTMQFSATVHLCVCLSESSHCPLIIDMADERPVKKSKGFFKHLKKVFQPGSQSTPPTLNTPPMITTDPKEAANFGPNTPTFESLSSVGRMQVKRRYSSASAIQRRTLYTTR
jgi:hypothetical protein